MPEPLDGQPQETEEETEEVTEETLATASETAQLEEQIELLTAERDQMRDQALRAMADLQNFRKRALQERQVIERYATEALVRDLLPVLDNFERTVAAAQQGATLEAVVEGVGAVHRQLMGALEARQVRRLATVGQEFDPEKHEAIGTDATEDTPEDIITVELEAGYQMVDRVIRPARVRVAKRP